MTAQSHIEPILPPEQFIREHIERRPEHSG